MQTDYDTFSVVYSCDIVKFQVAWILTRKPLDRRNPADVSEINRIYSLAKNLLNTNVPNFDFDQVMRNTI